MPGPTPGYCRSYNDVKALAHNDVWVSASWWSPSAGYHPFMLHWNGLSWAQIDAVPFAGGPIVGTPSEMYLFGFGGVFIFDGLAFTDAHLLSGFETLPSFGLSAVEQTDGCPMFDVGLKDVAGDLRTLSARLEPNVPISPSPDLNGDGGVNGADLAVLLGAWGGSGAGDLNQDGVVDAIALATSSGPGPAEPAQLVSDQDEARGPSRASFSLISRWSDTRRNRQSASPMASLLVDRIAVITHLLSLDATRP